MSLRKLNTLINYVIIVFIFISTSNFAHAGWEGESKPEFANGYTLKGGEFVVGFLRPSSVGLVDRLQLSTSLLADALGVFNADFKLKVLDRGPFVLSLAPGGFYSVWTKTGGVGGSLISSLSLGKHFIFSISPGYYHIFNGPDENLESTNNASIEERNVNHLLSPKGTFTLNGDLEIVFNPNNILVLNIAGVPSGKEQRLQTSVFYAHSWESFRLGAGLAYSPTEKFEVGDVSSPVFPMVDLWWRW